MSLSVLHVLPYLPVPKTFGGALRIYHLLRHFERHHDVRVVAYADLGDRDLFFREFPSLVSRTTLITRPGRYRAVKTSQLASLATRHSFWYSNTFSQQMQNALDDLSGRHHIDVIQFEFPMLGQFRLDPRAIRILDAHNVEYDNLKRMSAVEGDALRRIYYRIEAAKVRREELAIASSTTAVLTTSRRDAELFGSHLPNLARFVIPNGVETAYFHPAATPRPQARRMPPRDAGTMVFTGMMGYVPNYDGMIHFLRDILPRIRRHRPGATLSIVGKQPPDILREHLTEGVRLTGYVPDVRPFVWSSDVYVVPLRMGGGTRLKVLEAMAMGIPIVTTSIGCEGIDVEDGVHVLIRDDPESFADAVDRLMEDRPLVKRLTREALNLVRETYDWELIGGRLDATLSHLMASRYHPAIR